jgi:peptidoglycan hydrolase-like protein with peptidoglycan-binding domain
VALLQAALITLRHRLPISTKKYGAPDGIFGLETKNAVMAFQSAQRLKVDGVAGRHTLTRLDALLPAPAPRTLKPPKIVPAPALPVPLAPADAPDMPYSTEFKVGTDDPKITPDPGAGRWNSEPKQILTAAKYLALCDILTTAYVVMGDDAARHLAHYLGNTGMTFRIDLEGMIAEVGLARWQFERQLDRLKDYVGQLPPGTHDVTSMRVEVGYNLSDDSWNWCYAVGGYLVWMKGRATIVGTGLGHDCRLDLEYKFFDRYNWDRGKRVRVAGVWIEDDTMGDLHRQGMAQEFDMVGTIRRTLHWKAL